MPQYRLSSASNYDVNYGSSPSYTTHGSGGRPGNTLQSRLKMQHGSLNSVRLVTTSPDGLSMFTLLKSDINNRYVVEAHSFPLRNLDAQVENRDEERDEVPSLIRTQLPAEILSALEVDPPIEMLCVEGEGSTYNDEESGIRKLPRLCIYTRKNVFLLQIGCNVMNKSLILGSPTQYGKPYPGHLISVTEPFERYLERRDIIRIRPAPQRYSDYATVVPGACMAVLAYSRDTNEYSVLLHHSNGSVTVPAEWAGSEQLSGCETLETIVDFTFSQSGGLSIFPSTSILLLKGSGEVLAASPIVFDGTVVAKSFIQEGLDYLQSVKELLSTNRNTAKYRQYKAAEQYLLDVFGAQQQGNSREGATFCSARILSHTNTESAAMWPVSIQGPVVIQNTDENALQSPAVAIEVFGSNDTIAGIAIAKTGYDVDFVAISPTSLIPRFSFESLTDFYDLNDEQYKLSSVVEKVSLCNETNQSSVTTSSSISLVKDPISNHLLHYATESSVCCISTNVMKLTGRELSGESVRDPARTTAWSSLNSSSNCKSAIIGIAVSNDIDMNHELVVRLADGSIEQINITESQYLHELDTVLQDGCAKTEMQSPMLLLEADPTSSPLHEKIEPLVKKITSGLSEFSKIVGTDTHYKDITPEVLAVAVKLKEKCDNEIVLPLLELKSMVESRKNHLKSVLDSQKKQINSLNKTVNSMRDKMNTLSEQLAKAEEKAANLSERSRSVLQSSNSLLPTITQAEYEYFQDLKRLNRKVTLLQQSTAKLQLGSKSKYKSIDVGKVCKVLESVDASKIAQAHTILKGEETLLEQTRKVLIG